MKKNEGRHIEALRALKYSGMSATVKQQPVSMLFNTILQCFIQLSGLI